MDLSFSHPSPHTQYLLRDHFLQGRTTCEAVNCGGPHRVRASLLARKYDEARERGGGGGSREGVCALAREHEDYVCECSAVNL